MKSSPRRHRSYWAFIGHRLSGVALALFLPMHFLVLGLALEGAAEFDRFLVLAEMPLVKAAEWGLVVLLSIHLFFGLRLLALELCRGAMARARAGSPAGSARRSSRAAHFCWELSRCISNATARTS